MNDRLRFWCARGEPHPGASRHVETSGTDRLPLAEVPQVDHRVSQGFQSVVKFTEAFEAQQQALELSSQANTRSMVLNRSWKMAASKKRLRPRFICFLPRGFSVSVG